MLDEVPLGEIRLVQAGRGRPDSVGHRRCGSGTGRIRVVPFIARQAGTAPVVSFNVPIPGGGGGEGMFALSPDGQNLAIASPEKGQLHLWVRPMEGLEARLLPGGDGARYPFWSPDGKQIGFFADGKLKRISLEGGDPTVVADVGLAVDGGTWSGRVIVFATDNDIYKVEDTGGNPVPLAGKTGLPRNPEFLPDGRHFLYANRDGGSYARSLDGVVLMEILPVLARAIYADGNLLFRRQGRLTAQAFDAAKLDRKRRRRSHHEGNQSTRRKWGPRCLSPQGADTLAYQAQSPEQLVGRPNRSGEGKSGPSERVGQLPPVARSEQDRHGYHDISRGKFRTRRRSIRFGAARRNSNTTA